MHPSPSQSASEGRMHLQGVWLLIDIRGWAHGPEELQIRWVEVRLDIESCYGEGGGSALCQPKIRSF